MSISVEYKQKLGTWVIKGSEPPEETKIIVSKWYKGWKFRDQPEVVNWVLERWPEIRPWFDWDKYKKWCEALDKAPSIKEKKNVKFGPGFDFGKYTPYPHQAVSLQFALSLPSCALFMEPGTGKTFVAIHAAKARIKAGQVEKVLVVAPASILNMGWARDIKKFTNLRHIICSNGKKSIENHPTALEEQLEWPTNIYITSPHTLNMNKDLFKKYDFDMIIIDESTMFKNPDGEFFKTAWEFTNKAQYTMILTGTPIVGDLQDIWSQMKLVDNSLEDTIGEFRAKYFWIHPEHRFLMRPNRGARRTVINKIKNRCIHFKKKDCIDLPPRIPKLMDVELEATIVKHYEEFKETLYTRLENDHEIMAFNPLTEILRLHQIILGHTASGEETQLIQRPTKRLEVLKKIIKKAKKKVVVWALYRQDFKWIKEYLDQEICVINGATSNKEKQAEKFLDPGGPKVMVAHPKSAKFGHTWTIADTSVFYSYGYSLEDFYQARDRIYRIGQEDEVYEYMLCAGGIEDRILSAIETKSDFSKLAMNDLKGFLHTL